MMLLIFLCRYWRSMDFPSILALLLHLEQSFDRYPFVLPVLSGVEGSGVPFSWLLRQLWDTELIVCSWITVPREGASPVTHGTLPHQTHSFLLAAPCSRITCQGLSPGSFQPGHP